MEPNGVGSPTQNLNVAPQAQPQQQPVQQPAQQPQQIGGTPYQVVNHGQPQQQAPAPQPQQQAGDIQQLRQQLAQAAGVPVDQVPGDVATLSRIVLGGIGASQELQRLRSQQATQQPVQPTQQTQQQQLQPVQMPPGWETMVSKNQQGAYEPTHPAFAQVAQLANQNFAVQQMRQSVVQSGQFLPEHEKLIDQRVEQQVNQRLEKQRQDDFVRTHEQELYQMGPDGQRTMEWDPMTGKQQPAMSEFGLAFNRAADELLSSGAQFNSHVQLAQLAYKLAKERHKPQQQAGVNGSAPVNGSTNGPPSQIVNQDLAALFSQHNNNNTQRVANVNGHQPMATGNPRLDMRAALRNALANMPSSAPGTEYAKALGFNLGG